MPVPHPEIAFLLDLQFTRNEKKSLQQQNKTKQKKPAALVAKNEIFLSSYIGKSFFIGYPLTRYFFRFPVDQSCYPIHKFILTFWALLHYDRNMNSVLKNRIETVTT